MVSKLLSWLNEEDLASSAAESVKILIEKNDQEILTKKSFSILKPLYRQKIFNYCLPIIIEGFSASRENDKKKYYLIAMSHILCQIPHQTLLGESSKVIIFSK